MQTNSITNAKVCVGCKCTSNSSSIWMRAHARGANRNRGDAVAMGSKITRWANIPDPDCPKCDGVGWFEGGESLQTSCDCLRCVSKTDAKDFVTDGDLELWRMLYDSTEPAHVCGGETRCTNPC